MDKKINDDEPNGIVNPGEVHSPRKLYRRYKKYEPLVMEPLDFYALGRRIETRRCAKGLSRQELAERIGISATYLADIEYGTKTTTVKNLYAICRILDLSIHYMLTGSPHPAVTAEDAEIMCVLGNICSSLSVCTAHEIQCMEQMIAMCVEVFDLVPETSAGTLCTSTYISTDIASTPGLIIAKPAIDLHDGEHYLDPTPSETSLEAQQIENTLAYSANAILLLFGSNMPHNMCVPDTLSLPDMARRIKQRRLECRLSRADVAEYLDVGEHYVAAFEYGCKCISLPRFYTLMHLLHTTADDLTGARAAPIRFADPDARESIHTICDTILHVKPEKADRLFRGVQNYVKALHK